METADRPVRVRHEGRVGWIVVDNPPANSLSQAVLTGLRSALNELEADPEIRAAVVTGEGPKFFVAGADIKEFRSDGPPRTHSKIADGQSLTLEMERSRLPLVAAVNGYALGGGLELAMACDLRVAAAHARVGQTEIRLGIIPGWGGTQRLPRLIGRGRALELLLTGDQIEAPRALELGLFNQVVDGERLLEVAGGLAERLASLPPRAAAAIKRAVSEGLDSTLADGLGVELREFDATFATADAAEGIEAFVEKRAPRWTGA